MVGPPEIETMMAKDVVMCNTGECVAAGKRKYQPGAVTDNAVKRSIGSTIGFHNYGEGPYSYARP